MPSVKNIVLLGATGSIGDSTLKVIRANPDRLKLVGIAADRNYSKLSKIATEFKVRHIGIYNNDAYKEAKDSGQFNGDHSLYGGQNGLTELSTLSEADTIVVAVVGIAGLQPTIAALECKKQIALASKEILVKAGKFVMAAAKQSGSSIVPLDSEHNAIFQCIQGQEESSISKLILTASGGPFLNRSLEDMGSIKPEDALKHPNWSMGPKVTIDSSTMANKGLELIEARWLFNMRPDQLQVVIHPQSMVHSLVEFIDGSILAHLSPPSMTFPIQHSLLYPDRTEKISNTLDFSKVIQLDFQPPDIDRFACLRLARDCLDSEGTAPAVFNAANEVAVASFLKNDLPYMHIPEIIEQTLNEVELFEPQDLESIMDADSEARIIANRIIEKSR